MKDLALESIKLLPEQARQAWEKTSKLEFSKEYRLVKNIVIAGMGGSAYSYYVIRSLYEVEPLRGSTSLSSLKIPLVLANDYRLPAFVDKNTLVIASSYSGNTEETLTCVLKALKKRAKLTAITCGGKLAEMMEKHNLLYYHFDPQYNPSGQPRMGQGYMILGTLGILDRLNLLKVEKIRYKNLLKEFELLKSEAQILIGHLKNRILVFVAAEHLSGNAHILRNQTNETAKNFASYSLIPELNHHLMEGLTNPKKKNLLFLFLDSKLYSPQIKKRLRLTKEVLEKNKIPVLTYQAKSEEVLREIMEILIFGGYLTYYLANYYRVDPNKIPWVDYFKKKLASKA